MNYQDFKKKLVYEVKSQIGEEEKVTLHKVQKNNGVELDAITICEKGDCVAPTFYVEDCYQEFQCGKSIRSIVAYVINYYQAQCKCKKIDVEYFKQFHLIRSKVLYKLVNYEKNKKLLEDIPHEKVLDLAIVYYYQVPTNLMENATILIRNKDMKYWGITYEELAKVAKENTPVLLPYKYLSMENVMREALDEEDEESLIEEMMEEDYRIPMFVLTNHKKYFGAAAIVYPTVLECISEQLQSDLFILPSSIHECIIVPISGVYSKKELEEMVTEINETQVATEEILSNHVYIYRRSIKKITL